MKMMDKLKVLALIAAADVLLIAGLWWVLIQWNQPDGREVYSPAGQVQQAAGGDGRADGVNGNTAARPAGSPADETAGERRPGDGMKCVALTFDDGPQKDCTKDLLDGLKARGAKATFFLMGQNIPGNEELVKRMYDEGHLIGNHSFRHIQLTKEGSDAVCEAVDKTGQMIQEITGEYPQYLRPPYGAWNDDLECRVDMTTVLWSVDSLDWKLQNRQKIVRRVLKDVKDGDIILMHDIFPTSVEAALEIIDTLTSQGYTFVTVDELLID